ncbi:MAG: phosphotransferase [Erysipelotrichaceae bacterium]|jgi:serine/threonine protein kinase|nr:aminoglycoside phosphotransferase family protein [Bacilli bacterium]NLJ32500.1 phosphotransferase [Erysipelotrichaceae bacterium]
MKLKNVISKRSYKTVYVEDGKIIKLFVKGYPKTNVFNEALNQTRMEGSEINVPKVIEVVEIDGCWAFISEEIKGKTLEQLMIENPDKLDEYLDIFIDTQILMSKQNSFLLNPLAHRMSRRIARSELRATTRYDFQIRLEEMEQFHEVVHGDYNPSNIIIDDNGKVWVIDWAHVSEGNAAADVAKTYLWFNLHDQNELSEKYLKRYVEKSVIEEKFIRNWMPLVAAWILDTALEEKKSYLRNIVKQEIMR